MSELKFTDDNFAAEVKNSKGLVVVDFFATWCGPCKMMAPAIAKLALQYAGKAKIGKMDVDENPVVSGEFGIQSIPTLVFFKDGEPVENLVGFQSEEALNQKIEALL